MLVFELIVFEKSKARLEGQQGTWGLDVCRCVQVCVGLEVSMLK